MSRRPAVGGSAVAVLAGTVVLLLWCTRGLITEAQRTGPASYDTLLGLAVAAIAATCLVWLAAGALLVVLGSLSGAFARWADGMAYRLAPARWRRTVHLALGAALLAGPISSPVAWADDLAPTSAAAAAAGDEWPSLPSVDRPDPATLPPVDRPAEECVDQRSDPAVQSPVEHPHEEPIATPSTAWTPVAPPAPARIAAPADPLLTGSPRAAVTVAEDVVVHRGDTLWHIAARHLGPAASAAEVAAEWPRWWSTNRSTIGEDPDLILPGQRLRAPS